MDGRADGALSLDQALGLDPENASPSGPKGRSAWPRAGSRRPRTCSSALEGSPETWVYIELGELYRRLGRFEEALERLEFALGLDPDDAYARHPGSGPAGERPVRRGDRRPPGRHRRRAVPVGDRGAAAGRLRLAGPTRLQDVLVALDSISAAETGTVVVARSEVLRLLGRGEAMTTIDAHLAVEPDDVAGRAGCVRCSSTSDVRPRRWTWRALSSRTTPTTPSCGR